MCSATNRSCTSLETVAVGGFPSVIKTCGATVCIPAITDDEVVPPNVDTFYARYAQYIETPMGYGRKVAVAGVGKTPFGSFADKDLRTLAVAAGNKALENA